MTRVYDKRAITKMIQGFFQKSNLDASLVPTGIFDDRTKEAVSKFQRQNKLDITGIVDEITLRLLYDNYLTERLKRSVSEGVSSYIEFPILPGERSNGLIQIHRAMAVLLTYYGYNHNIRESNFYNKETENAVKILRSIYLLDASSSIDQEMYFRIMNDLESINKLKKII